MRSLWGMEHTKKDAGKLAAELRKKGYKNVRIQKKKLKVHPRNTIYYVSSE